MSNIKRPEFIEYFLKGRLKRVPISVLQEFLVKLMRPTEEKLLQAPKLGFVEQGKKDTVKKYSQQQLIDEIIHYYNTRKDEETILVFQTFIRDHLFSAKESVYLIQIPNQGAVIEWIKSWKEKKYHGQRFIFSMHTHISLQEKILTIENNKTPFPSDVILLIANSHTVKVIPSGMELIEFYPTVEIELIFRRGMNLMEARGELSVILDFVNTAIIDSNNPLSLARSFFIGEREEAKIQSVTEEIAKTIKIDALKTALKGKYRHISAPVQGDKTSRIQADLEELDDLKEETNTWINPMLKVLIKDQDRSSIVFTYNDTKYSFSVTKRGGLTFRQYAPEEVLTYIVSKINSL